MSNLTDVWDHYYADSDEDTAIKDRAFFDLEIDALLSRVAGFVQDRGQPRARVLELGSGTGYLASRLVDALQAIGCALEYDGVDFSEVATARATDRGLPGCTFHRSDFLDFVASAGATYDYVVTQRSIMAVMEQGPQRLLLEGVRARLAPDGIGLLSEGSNAGFDRLKKLRAQVGLEGFEKVWHSRYLDEEVIRDVFPSAECVDFSSVYWLVTRVVYPLFEEPKHNQPIHSFAASLPQTGDFGLVKLWIVRPA